jgi:hypothetical protein
MSVMSVEEHGNHPHVLVLSRRRSCSMTVFRGVPKHDAQALCIVVSKLECKGCYASALRATTKLMIGDTEKRQATCKSHFPCTRLVYLGSLQPPATRLYKLAHHRHLAPKHGRLPQ